MIFEYDLLPDKHSMRQMGCAQWSNPERIQLGDRKCIGKLVIEAREFGIFLG